MGWRCHHTSASTNPLSSGQSRHHVGIMFLDFSSAFNTNQPALTHKILQKIQVDASTITWISDYLTNRPQFVRQNGCVSDQVVSSTGAPLSLFLFSLYTKDFPFKYEFLSSTEILRWCCSCGVYHWWTRDWVQRTGGLLGGMTWEKSSHLNCDQDKNEMTVDFWRTRNKSNSISIMGGGGDRGV